ncbi:outer membrane porin GjpA [Gordonia sp. CPCC 205515]|uniref:outer membrane porin GjpA n=1 Tax=Gordonia sp. CPCC 205515 TaxID=3140791 RepID=UPI003AF3BD75
MARSVATRSDARLAGATSDAERRYTTSQAAPARVAAPSAQPRPHGSYGSDLRIFIPGTSPSGVTRRKLLQLSHFLFHCETAQSKFRMFLLLSNKEFAVPRTAAATIDVNDNPSRRPWLVAGVAAASASMLALTPALHSGIPDAHKAIELNTIKLTADWKPLAPYIDQLNAASAGASTLFDNFMLAPGLSLQQAIVNQAGYLNAVISGTSTIEDVAGEMRDNLHKIVTGLSLISADSDTTSVVTNHSVDGLHGLVLQLLPTFLPADSPIDPSVISAVMNVLASPLSGVLIGMAGPFVSPPVALLNSALTIAAAIKAGDPDAAFSDLLATPANVAGSFFNGATLDLSGLTPLINSTGVLGTTTLNSLDIAFGGLFTAGSIGRGSYDVNGNTITAPGGSMLNSVGMSVTTDALGFPFTLDIPSQAVGPIGALEGMSQTVGALLGDNWDGKSGNPTPPLAGLHFPTFPGGSDDSSSSTDTGATAASVVSGKHVSETASVETSAQSPAAADPGTEATTTTAAADTPETATTESSSTGFDSTATTSVPSQPSSAPVDSTDTAASAESDSAGADSSGNGSSSGSESSSTGTDSSSGSETSSADGGSPADDTSSAGSSTGGTGSSSSSAGSSSGSAGGSSSTGSGSSSSGSSGS